jgi:glucosamine--fructose-6-phosphate aminotransferase (isomerizing)
MNGELMLAEIREQPEALRRLINQTQAIDELEEALKGSRPSTIRLVAHGSSDNAASFGIYGFARFAKTTAFRDAISLSVYYDEQLSLDGSMIVALSQSGRTPDVVEYVERLAGRGATAIAITNDPSSPLAKASNLVLPLQAGEEKAVAATKTYTSTLAALALVSGLMSGAREEVEEGILEVADQMETALPLLEPLVEDIAQSYTFCERMFVIGRGFEYATARETALKLTETCRIVATALTVTDFAHGPVAAVGPLFPMWVVASQDPNLPATIEATKRAAVAGAEILVTGSAAFEVEDASKRIYLPPTKVTALAPILSIVPGQLFSRSLALAKRLDPDAPVNLKKVTEAL